MKPLHGIAYLLVLLSFSSVIAQATTCAPIVQQALSAVEQDCAPTGRNQACYGYVSLQATPRDGAQNFSFTKDGDLADVSNIDTLRLSALDLTDNTWGIALMKLQANLPDTLPGENVTFLLFGDVQLQNVVTPGATVQVTASGRVNVRSAPSTSGAIIGTMAAGETAAANGRSADGSWLQIQLPDSSALGWVSASVVKISGDTSALTVVGAAQAQTSYTPMQAFYFTTGITQTGCSAAPADGILIQTPQGVGQIDLRANDVDVQLGSTAFLQAQASGSMTVSVLEGEAHVTASGVTVAVPAGTQASIPLDANLHPTGAPSAAQPYDFALVQNLPIQVLPLPISIAQPEAASTPEAQATPEVTATASAGSGESGSAVGGAGYQVVKVMNLGGAVPSGTVCALDQPFAVMMAVPQVSFTVNFTPSGSAQGTWAFQYTIASAGETDSASGSYTVGDAAADGSRRLVLDGSITSKFRSGGGTFPLHYEIGLTPLAACG